MIAGAAGEMGINKKPAAILQSNKIPFTVAPVARTRGERQVPLQGDPGMAGRVGHGLRPRPVRTMGEQNGEREAGGGVVLDVHGIKDATRSVGFINWLEVIGLTPDALEASNLIPS
jgi:hypothetical protein